MKDLHEVLRQKEAELARVKLEIECLRIVAPLISDTTAEESSKKEPMPSSDAEPAAEATGTDGLATFFQSTDSHPRFWDSLRWEK